MRRHCIGCGEPAAVPRRRTDYAFDFGLPVGSELAYQCRSCGREFKLLTPGMKILMALLGLVLVAMMIFVASTVRIRSPGDRAGILAILVVQLAAAVVHLRRRLAAERKALPVTGDGSRPDDP